MIFLLALLLVAAVFSTKLSARFGVPGLLLFLGLGLVAGSDGLGLIAFSDASLAKRIADLALVFVLFESGFHTSGAKLRAAFGPAVTLATAGVAATALALAAALHFLLRWPLERALLVGAIVSSTDAAALIAMLRQRSIRARVSTTLEVESATNDPMAIMLTVVLVETLVSGSPSGARLGPFLLRLAWQFGGGLAIGFAGGAVARFLFDRLDSENRGYYYALSIGVALLAFGAADAIGANGIIAVFFAGFRLGNSEFALKRGVSNFVEGVSSVANLGVFLLLGLLAFPRQFAGVWKEGLAAAALLTFVARPVAVLLFAAPFRFRFRELVFLAWGGIKGAVPIVLATYPAAAGLDPDGGIFNVVFFVVLASSLVQGGTLDLAAKVLRLAGGRLPKPPHSLELLSRGKTELELVELRVEPGVRGDGASLRELALPEGALVSAVMRENAVLAPRGHTRLAAGDLIYVLAPPEDATRVAAVVNGPRPESPGTGAATPPPSAPPLPAGPGSDRG